MSNYVNLFLYEFRFYFFTKYHYLQQTSLTLVEKTLFFIGMVSILLFANKSLACATFIQVCLWFCMVNSFGEMAKRLESEQRLKQYAHLSSLKTSYWFISIARCIPCLLESFLIIAISSICMLPFIRISGSIPFINVGMFMILGFIQYILFNLVLICIALYFKRIQALLGFIEFFLFFYSGMVLSEAGFSFSMNTWMNAVLRGDLSHMISLIVLLCIEIIILFIIIKIVHRAIRKRGE